MSTPTTTVLAYSSSPKSLLKTASPKNICVTIPTTTLSTSIPKSVSINCASAGNGYCDDQTNLEACDFDGGDCCGDNVNTDYCTVCICYVTGMINHKQNP